MDKLKSLTILELSMLLEHVKQGFDHLNKILTSEQLTELFQLGYLASKQKQHIKSDKTEKSGNAALVVNAIITSIFGAWMGLSGFIGFNLGSLLTFVCILSIATLIGWYIGYCSFQLIKMQSSQALIQQNLFNVQITILKMINKKRRTAIKKLLYSIKQLLGALPGYNAQALDIRSLTTNHIQDLIAALNKLIDAQIKAIQAIPLYHPYQEQLIRLKNKWHKLLDSHHNVAIQNEDETRKQSHACFLYVLTNPHKAPAKIPVKSASWFKTNKIALTVGLAPTLLGGFASMFVFIGGGPDISHALGFHDIATLLRKPTAKVVEFSIAIALTAYFGYSHIYNNYKTFKRQQELEKSQKLIANLESKMIEYNAQFNLIHKIKLQLTELKQILSIIQHLKSYLSTKEVSHAD